MSDLPAFNAVAETARKQIEELMLSILENDQLVKELDGGSAFMAVFSGGLAAIANTMLALDTSNVLFGGASIHILQHQLEDHWRQARARRAEGGTVQ